MTERTIIKKSLMMDDDDSISVNSTQESEADEEKSYVVDRILAEQDDDEGNKYYLILWEGYELLASTWEPAENIEGQATIDDWTDEKMRVARGFSKEFDVAEFEEKLETIRLAKEARQARRKAKREKLGLAASFFDSGDEVPISVVEQRDINPKIAKKPFEDSLEPETPKVASKPKSATSRGKRAAREKPLKNTIATRARRRTINLPSQGYMSDTSEEPCTAESKKEFPDTNSKDENYNRTKRRRPKGAPSFVSDEESSSSIDKTTFKIPKKPIQENSKTEPPSRTGYQGTAKKAFGDIPAASSVQAVPPSRGATRGRSSGRGRGRGRGAAHTQAGKFSFTTPNINPQIPQRKKSLANAILNAPNVDSCKPIEHFKTPSMVRKAELAARSLADRAPDFQSVGFLSRPSDYTTRLTRKRSQIVQEDIEICQSNEIPSTLNENERKSASDIRRNEGDVTLNRAEVTNEAEIMKRTAELDLSKPNARPQTGSRSSKLLEEVHISPGVLAQQGTSLSVEKLGNSIHGVNEANTKPLQQVGLERCGALELETATTLLENVLSQQPKPVTKINLSDYKARRKSEFLGDAVAVQALIGGREGTPILIGLTDMDNNLRSYWTPVLEGLGVLNFSRSCIAQEFQAQMSLLRSKTQATGNVIIGANEIVILEDIAEQLRPCSGLIFIRKLFFILIFPAKCEEWKFIDSSSDVDHRLRYQIFIPNFSDSIAGQLDNAFAETRMSCLDLKRQYLDTLVELAQNLRYETLLPSHVEGQDVHNFYLFFPKRAATSAKYIASWLRSCKVDCRIYTNQKPGSWDLFTNNPVFKVGTIILHESILPSISKIPRISSLINDNFHFSFWCMDDGYDFNPFRSDYNRIGVLPSCEASMIRLFPHGGAILLTPSFLLTQPERTYELLQWFHKKVSRSTPGTWKLVLPNKCREHLLDLATRMSSVRKEFDTSSLPEKDRYDAIGISASQLASKQQCMAAFRSYTIIDQLLKKESMSGFPGYWEEDFPDECDSSVIYVDECIGRNDEKGLVYWFAAWTMLNVNLYRKFIVVGTARSKRRSTDSSKGTSLRLLGEKLQAAPTIQGAQATELTRSATSSNIWNRNAFHEVKKRSLKLPSSFAISSEEQISGESFTTQTLGSVTKPKNSVTDFWSGESTNLHVPAGSHSEPKSIDPNSKEMRQSLRTKHGIDETQPQSILEFIAITGRDAETARRYLSRHNWDVHNSVQSYWHSTRRPSPQRFSATDGAGDSGDQSAVVDFIAGTHASAQIAETYLHLAQDDVRRAISLYKNSQQQSRSPSGGLSNQDRVGEREFVNRNGPASRVRVTFSEAEREMSERSDDDLRQGSMNASEAAHMLDPDPAETRTSGGDIYSSKAVNAVRLSPSKRARTLCGELVEEPEDIHHSDKAFSKDQKIYNTCKNIAIGLDRDTNDDFQSTSTKNSADQQELVPETDIIDDYDGVNERVSMDEKRYPRGSGIVSNEAGTRRYVPKSFRPSGTIRPEIGIRPGFIPAEDKPVYKIRRAVGGTPQYEADDMGNSSSGPKYNSKSVSPTAESRRSSVANHETPLGSTGENMQMDLDFEPTVEWYGELRKKGQGWEHIYVGGWESCFQKLLIKN